MFSSLKAISCWVAKSCLTLWPHKLQPIRLPCSSLSPRVHWNFCPLTQWCHPTISFSVTPFSYSPWGPKELDMTESVNCWVESNFYPMSNSALNQWPTVQEQIRIIPFKSKLNQWWQFLNEKLSTWLLRCCTFPLGVTSILGKSQWQPTPALLPGKSHGQRSLVDCSPWGR